MNKLSIVILVLFNLLSIGAYADDQRHMIDGITRLTQAVCAGGSTAHLLSENERVWDHIELIEDSSTQRKMGRLARYLHQTMRRVSSNGINNNRESVDTSDLCADLIEETFTLSTLGMVCNH